MTSIMKNQTQKNPYMGTVTETRGADGSEQVNLKSEQGSVQVNRGADGNITTTTTKKMDFSDVMPFVSMQPAAGAMDQIFGTQMAQHIPSQAQQTQQMQILNPRPDPLAELKRQNIESQIRAREAEDPLLDLRRQKLERDIEQSGKVSPKSQLEMEQLAANIALKKNQTKKAEQEAAIKKKAQEGELQIKDWELTGDIQPRPGDVAKLRKQSGTAAELNEALTELSALVEKNGTMPDDEEAWAEMRRLHTRVTTALKNEEELGALTGPDLPLLLRELGAVPGSPQAMFTPNSTYRTGLETLRKQINSRVKNQLTQFGYVPKQGQSAPPSETPSIEIGHVEDGYAYQGGDPSDPKSWVKQTEAVGGL